MGSGREIQICKLSLFVTAYIQSKKHYFREQSKNENSYSELIKTALLPVKLETFRVAYIIGHECDGMAHVHVMGGVSTVSVVSVSRLSH